MTVLESVEAGPNEHGITPLGMLDDPVARVTGVLNDATDEELSGLWQTMAGYFGSDDPRASIARKLEEALAPFYGPE